MATDYGHWIGKRFNPEDHFGFVYKITNKTNGKSYIGQKQLHTTVKRPPLKGRKNKRHFKKESEWRTYTGSSKSLNEDIEKLGKDKFEFRILQLCDSKWELSYREYSKIIKEDAIILIHITRTKEIIKCFRPFLNIPIIFSPVVFVDHGFLCMTHFTQSLQIFRNIILSISIFMIYI